MFNFLGSEIISADFLPLCPPTRKSRDAARARVQSALNEEHHMQKNPQNVGGFQLARSVAKNHIRIPSGKHTKSYWKWPIEIVDLPMIYMVIFHSYVNVYQRVYDWYMLESSFTSMGWIFGPSILLITSNWIHGRSNPHLLPTFTC